jgi:hypothetical protein
MMEAIEVRAHFNIQGEITPLDFTWHGQNYSIESVGRQWGDEAGKHILVMVPGGRVFELIFHPAESRWLLRRITPNPTGRALLL